MPLAIGVGGTAEATAGAVATRGAVAVATAEAEAFVGAESGECSRIGGIEGWPLLRGAVGEWTSFLGSEGQEGEVAVATVGVEEAGAAVRPEKDLDEEERKEEKVGEKGKPTGEEGEAE